MPYHVILFWVGSACSKLTPFLLDSLHRGLMHVGTGPPVGVGIGSLPVTPKINGEIGAMCVESGLAGVAQQNKT